MWFLCAILTFTFWGLADLFYKIGNKEDDQELWIYDSYIE